MRLVPRVQGLKLENWRCLFVFQAHSYSACLEKGELSHNCFQDNKGASSSGDVVMSLFAG